MQYIVARHGSRVIVHSNEASMTDRLPIDAAVVRRLNERRPRPGPDDFLGREVARRLHDRLAPIRHEPHAVVDLGCGPGSDAGTLRGRFDGVRYVGVDHAHAALRAAAGRHAAPGAWSRWLGKRPSVDWVHADFGALPFPARTFDALWSNLAIHWSPEPHCVLREWGRIANVGALVCFSAFGPDTMIEVVRAFEGLDDRAHVAPFTDMHDYGDMLVDAGFTAPVVDVERLTLTYADEAALWRDVRAQGGLAAIDRRRGLMGRASRERVSRKLGEGRDAEGRYRLSVELVYAHAWKAEPRRTAGGEAIVRVERLRR